MTSKDIKNFQEVQSQLREINDEVVFKRGQLKVLELELRYLRSEIDKFKRIYSLGTVLNRIFTVKNLTRIFLIIIIFSLLS